MVASSIDEGNWKSKRNDNGDSPSPFQCRSAPLVGEHLTVQRNEGGTVPVSTQRNIIACLASGDYLQIVCGHQFRKKFGLRKSGQIRATFGHQGEIRDVLSVRNGRFVPLSAMDVGLELVVISLASRDTHVNENVPAYDENAVRATLAGTESGTLVTA